MTDEEMDALLGECLSDDIPEMRPDFETRLRRRIERRNAPLGRGARWLLAGYGGLSAGVSAVILREQSWEWTWIAAVLAVPVMIAALVNPIGGRRS